MEIGMLPDFPGVKERLLRIVNRYLQRLIREEPFLSEIREERHFEGNKISSRTDEGNLDESGYIEMSGNMVVKKEEIIVKGPAALVEKIKETAEQIKKQKAEVVFKKLNEITEQAGTVVNAKGGPFTFDLFLESLKKIRIDFDDQGNPHMPTLVMSPVLAARIKEKIPEWESAPKYKKQFDEIMVQKKKEWDDRESNRKLAD